MDEKMDGDEDPEFPRIRQDGVDEDKEIPQQAPMDNGEVDRRAFLATFLTAAGLFTIAILFFLAIGTGIDILWTEKDFSPLLRTGLGFIVAVILRVAIDVVRD